MLNVKQICEEFKSSLKYYETSICKKRHNDIAVKIDDLRNRYKKNSIKLYRAALIVKEETIKFQERNKEIVSNVNLAKKIEKYQQSLPKNYDFFKDLKNKSLSLQSDIKDSKSKLRKKDIYII